MHASINSSPHAPLESAYASSSLFSLDAQSINIGLMRQTLYPNKSPSDFFSPRPGNTPNVNEPPLIRLGHSPENNTTTTNESYSVDNCFQVNNSDLLNRLLRNNTSTSHPVTTKGSPRRRDLSCDKETSSGQMHHIHLLEYEEFTPEKEVSMKVEDVNDQEDISELPENKERVIRLNEVQQQADKGKSSSRHSAKERSRQDSDSRNKGLSDSSKEQADGKELRHSEGNNKLKSLFEGEKRNTIKRGKERTETSTENSESGPIINKDKHVLLKETELLRNMLREKERLLGMGKRNSEQIDAAKINEECNKENLILKSDLAKMAEALKSKSAEIKQLREINQNQREAALKLEEKFLKMEKINFNLEKIKKHKDDEIRALQEEVQALRNNKLKHKDDLSMLQQNFEDLKNKYEATCKTLNQEKTNQSAEKVKGYKGKIINLKNMIKSQQETIISKDNAIVNLLGKLEEIAASSALKDLEINRFREEVITLSEELKLIKSTKARVKTKSSDENQTKISSREHLTETSGAESSRSVTKRTKKSHSNQQMELDAGFNSKRSTSTQDSCLQSVNQISSVRGSQKSYEKVSIPEFRKTEKLKARDNSEKERENSIERNKTIKKERVTKGEGSANKEGRATHLNMDQLKFYEAFYSKRNDSETPSMHPSSARGERRSKDSYMKNFVTNESHSGNITTDGLRTLNINKHILFNEGSSRPPRERQAYSQEREKDVKINNFLQAAEKNQKRAISPPTEDPFSHSDEKSSSRGTKHSSKRPSNIDRDYFDPYDIITTNSKPPLIHAPLSTTNSNFDPRKDIMSSKTTRESSFKKIHHTFKDSKSNVDDVSTPSYIKDAKGTPLSAVDSSKSSWGGSKTERASSKSGSKKKPSSGKKQENLLY